MPYKPGSTHGPSIKNNETYNALIRKGMSKGEAAAISNGALKKGYKKGKHHRKSHG
jgi:uncharacterized protein YoaH (UPF0181 family)